jgi:hypothetical protein
VAKKNCGVLGCSSFFVQPLSASPIRAKNERLPNLGS